MKSAMNPEVSIGPELRNELEAVLRDGETAAEFIEALVRGAVEFRRLQARFHERGQAAWAHYVATGHAVPAEDVLAKLQSRLDARRKQLIG